MKNIIPNRRAVVERRSLAMRDRDAADCHHVCRSCDDIGVASPPGTDLAIAPFVIDSFGDVPASSDFKGLHESKPL